MGISLRDEIDNESLSTIFVDGTFATVPKINHNCQLWAILVRHHKRISNTINLMFYSFVIKYPVLCTQFYPILDVSNYVYHYRRKKNLKLC